MDYHWFSWGPCPCHDLLRASYWQSLLLHHWSLSESQSHFWRRDKVAHCYVALRCQIQISQAAQACEYASSLNCANIFASVAWLPTGSAMFSGVFFMLQPSSTWRCSDSLSNGSFDSRSRSVGRSPRLGLWRWRYRWRHFARFCHAPVCVGIQSSSRDQDHTTITLWNRGASPLEKQLCP